MTELPFKVISLIPTLLPEGEGLCFPLPPGEGLRVREGMCMNKKINKEGEIS
jgi:hypothetical protein